jgi:hypothetical protein
MTRLNWIEMVPKYEAGVDRGVFFPDEGEGETWNGLITVTEDPADSDVKVRYQDGVKYRQRRTLDSFAGTIEAYTFPLAMNGRPFGLSYRVSAGDTYKIHIVYNVLVAPSARSYRQKEPNTFNWDFTTQPENFPGGRFGSHFVIDSSIAYPEAIEALEDMLYGSADGGSHLPTPDEIYDLFEANALLQIIDHGDGTWTAIGPDTAIIMLDSTTFQITWPSAIYISDDTYTISSL